MNKTYVGAVALSLCALAVPAAATLPTPPMQAAPVQAQPFLFYAGAGDVFEIVSSMMAVQKSQDPQVRAFATMLIEHHTQTTDGALAAAKAAGIMAPPPELSPEQKAMIGQLMGASGPAFDRVYLQQQLPAHQQALALMQGYARSGDTPELRQAAQTTVPVVQGHIAQIQQLMRAHS